MSKRNSNKIKFSFIQLTFWCSWCAFTSFAALYFKKNGLSQGEIGLAISLSTLAGILGQFVWGLLCDKLHTIKKNFIAANILIWIAILSFLFLKNTLWVFIFMMILGFAQVPQPSIIDTWILKRLPGKEEEYGHIRLWASAGFAVFALGFGWAINYFGFNIMFIAASFFILMTLIGTLLLPDIPKDECGLSSLRKSFKELISNKRYLFFIFICFIIGLAFRTIRLLLPLIIDNVKGDSGDLGLAYFFGVITEIPMFIASKKLTKRFKANVLVLFSVLLYTVEFIILILAASPFMVMVAMFAQGLAFGTYLPSVRLFVFENSPEELRTSAQTLADAIYSSLTAVIGTAVGGLIIETSGVKAVLKIGTGLLLLALVILVLDIFLKRKSSHEGNKI